MFNAEKFKADLMKIAVTTLSSKILSQDKDHFAKLAVDAVMRLKVSICCMYSVVLVGIQCHKLHGRIRLDNF